MKYRVTMYNETYQRDETYVTDCETEDVLLPALELFAAGGFSDIRCEPMPDPYTERAVADE